MARLMEFVLPEDTSEQAARRAAILVPELVEMFERDGLEDSLSEYLGPSQMRDFIKDAGALMASLGNVICNA